MNRISLCLLLCSSIILFLGLLMVYDITAAEVLDRELELSPKHVFFKQALYSCFALLVSYFVYRIGYERFLSWSKFFLFGIGALLFAVFLPKIGQQINGAHRWISIAGISFQPSELMKFAMPLYYIHVITGHEGVFQAKDFGKLTATLCFFMGIIFFEPDNGTTALLFLTLFTLFFLTKINWRYWVIPLCLFMGIGIFAATQMKHVPDRIRVYLHPEMDLLGKGHQPYQAKIAAGSGGLRGKGFGESLQKFNYIPEARSDYIAAIYAEEFGFLGILFLIILYLILAILGFKIALQAKDKAGFYIACIFTFLICFQAFLNLGVVSNLLPSKGTNLPFFSQGGSSLLANVIALAVILDISKKSRLKLKD